MPLSGLRLDAITEAHLQGLIENEVREGRRIDYKETVGGGDEAKREFLRDVSSFANAAGGDLLVGVAETDGVASGLPGMGKASVDGEILRLENVIRDGIEPRIPGIATRAVDVSSGSQAVLVMRVPRSWAGPHMVKFKGRSEFYSRNSAGKYPLDVTEIRAAFVGSESARTRLRSFRTERLGRLAANDGSVELLDNPKTVLHVVPVIAVDASTQYDVTELVARGAADPNTGLLFRPLRGMAWNPNINYEGAIAWAPGGTNESAAISYTQVFRNGAIEGVDASMLERDQLIPSSAFERELIGALDRYLALARAVGAPPPYMVALSLLGVGGLRLSRPERFIEQPRPFNRDDLILPEIVVEDPAPQPHTILKPLFDVIWNASGLARSPNYTSTGAWQPP